MYKSKEQRDSYDDAYGNKVGESFRVEKNGEELAHEGKSGIKGTMTIKMNDEEAKAPWHLHMFLIHHIHKNFLVSALCNSRLPQVYRLFQVASIHDMQA